MPQHEIDNLKLPITSSSVKAPGKRVIRLADTAALRKPECGTCNGPLTGPVCLKCNKVGLPPPKQRLQAVTPAVAQARCTHAHVECVTCCAVLENGAERSVFYPRGPNGGFIVEHELWNGELHPLEWFFGWEHPDTGEFFMAMPADPVLGVIDMCGILNVRPSWVFARSARWKSRLAMYEVKVRTIDWMIEIYYDRAELEQQEHDAFEDATYSRVRPETREERRIAIRMQHLAAGCTDKLCKKLHKPPRPRNRK